MRRRAFIAGLGAMAAWPHMGQAQLRSKPHRIGFLSEQPGQSSLFSRTFVESLRDLGYVEGQNITIEWRMTPDREQLMRSAVELAAMNLDAIVTGGGPAVRAAKQATSTTPIVMGYSGDPVGTGLVPSLSRPGGNLTGFSFMSPDLSAKRVEVLAEAFPTVRRLATLWNPEDPVYALELERTERAARGLGMTLLPTAVRAAGEFEAAFAAILAAEADALIVFAHSLTLANSRRLIEIANRQRFPTMYGLREYVVEGGLIAYGPRVTEMFRRSAVYVDRILKGTRPADMPVEQPTKFELAINLKTAKTLGVTLPPTLLARADEVIE
jgi:putative tryptophan/tyrosine transport system substrate-binding protein